MPPRGLAGRRALHLVIAVLTVLLLMDVGPAVVHVGLGYAVFGLLVFRALLAAYRPDVFGLRVALAGPDGGARTWLVRANGAVGAALAAAVLAAALSGAGALAQEYGKGPLSPFVPKSPGKGIIIGAPPAFAGEGESAAVAHGMSYRTLHTGAVSVSLGLLVLHVGGLALQSAVTGTNLFSRLNPRHGQGQR